MAESHNNNSSHHLQLAPVPPPRNGFDHGTRPMGTIFDALNRCGKRVEDATRKANVYADNVWHHFKVSPRFTDVAMARIAQGTKVLTEGGHEKVFQQRFGSLAGEKELKAYVCYLSTSSGPVTGTLYISTKRVAFWSDNPFYSLSPSGQQQSNYHKIVVQVEQLRTVNPSSNRMNPSEKYIQIVTSDGREYWFMGFISYDKVVKQLSEALRHSPHVSDGIPVTIT